MIEDHFSALPDAQRETARSALSAVIGAVPIGAITPIAGGATSASVFRVEAGGRRYLLRMEGEPSPLRNPHQISLHAHRGGGGDCPEDPLPR